MYYFQLFNNNTLELNLIPCKNSQGAVGMYDTVTKTFFGNVNNTGDDFKAGPEIK